MDFEDTDVVSIAKQLLGKVLYTNFNDQLIGAIITETEAYSAPYDKASHAYNNRRTKRTEVMFGEPGHAYVYLCYGIHYLFNIVTGPKDVAHAVLIRAAQPVIGIPQMMLNRKKTSLKPNLTAGPALVSQALGINTSHSDINILDPKSPISIVDYQFFLEEDQIIASPRVGVDYAEECAAWPWRFRIKDSVWTSPSK